MPAAGPKSLKAIPRKRGWESLNVAKEREAFTLSTYMSIEPVARHLWPRPTGRLWNAKPSLYCPLT